MERAGRAGGNTGTSGVTGTQSDPSYRATYRRSAYVILALLGVLLLSGMALAWLLMLPGPVQEEAALAIGGIAMLSMVAIMITGYRTHCWTLGADRLRIEERPMVPFTGLARRAEMALAEVAALRQVESGVERLIEIETRAGAVFRLPQARTAGPRGVGVPDVAGFAAFETELLARIAAARAAPIAVQQGLSFWNTLPGLAVLALMLLIATATAALTAYAIWGGMTLRHAGMQGAAIALLLPFGAAYLLVKAAKRRARVLADREGRPPR